MTRFGWLSMCVVAACSTSSGSAGDPDAAGGGGGNAGSDSAGSDSGGGGSNGSSNARLTGAITRTAQPMGDATGAIYVALFDKDPVANQSTAMVVARALIDHANLAAAGASVAYELDDVP